MGCLLLIVGVLLVGVAVLISFFAGLIGLAPVGLVTFVIVGGLGAIFLVCGLLIRNAGARDRQARMIADALAERDRRDRR